MQGIFEQLKICSLSLPGLGLSWGAGLRMVVVVVVWQLNGSCGIMLEQMGRAASLEDCNGLIPANNSTPHSHSLTSSQ